MTLKEVHLFLYVIELFVSKSKSIEFDFGNL